MVMKLPGSVVLFLLLIGCFACKPDRAPAVAPDPYAHLSDPEARTLLQRAIARAGGLEAWQSMRELHFQKYFALYDAAGNVESENLQSHDYRFQPEEEVRITWMSGGAAHRMTYRDGQAAKEVAGRADTLADPQVLVNNILSATFVISIPFKLLDDGVKLTYLGVDTLEDGQAVEVLRADYDPPGHDTHRTTDTWWHYFTQDDHRLAAYLVRHADHYSYVTNEQDTIVSGFLFPTVRESYRVDSLRNKLYLRARYRYADYEVRL